MRWKPVSRAHRVERDHPFEADGRCHRKAYRINDAEGRYIEFVKRSLPKELDFQGMKVVVDCANGAAYKVAPTVLRELGAKVEVIGDKPDGMNINAGCGAVHPERLQKAVHEQGRISVSRWMGMPIALFSSVNKEES